MDDISDSTIFGKKPQNSCSPNEAATTGKTQDDTDTAPIFTGWGDLAEGRFEPIRLLGRGGFAVVYRAYDRKLKRDVALKIPHFRMAPNGQAQQWLLREGQATAALKHPHIVTLYDFQVTGDSGYLVNELVDGPTLAEFVAEHPNGCEIREAVEIVAFIADALEHAHGNQVLHRDLKPSNILLDSNHSAGSLPFSPRLSDFGLASLPSQDTLSRSKDSLVGSIQYIPPEVIENPSERFTKQGDIYSLSCILYELLTGKRAFSGSTTAEIINKIIQNNAVPLRQLRPAIPKDLAAICYQAMAGSPSKRYARASLLAQDLRNYLNGQPIMARQPSLIERTRRLIQRHPAVTTACLLVSGALISIISIIVSNNRNLKAINEELSNTNVSLEQALEREAITRLQNERIIYSQDMMAAGEDFQANNLRSVRSILSRYSDGTPLADHRDVEWSFLSRQVRISPDVIWKSQAALYVGCYSSDGKLFATAGADALITVLNSRSGEVVRQWESGQLEVNGVVFSSDDRWLWTSGDDGTVRAWTVETGEELWQVQAFNDAAMAYDLVYLQQSDCLIIRSSNNRLQAISAATGQRKGDLENREELHYSVKASPVTNQFFTTGREETLHCFDGERLEKLNSIQLPKNPNNGPRETPHILEISRDGRYAAMGMYSGRLGLIDLKSWLAVEQIFLPDKAEQLFFVSGDSLDSSRPKNELVAASRDATFFRMSIADGQPMEVFDSWTIDSQRIHGMYQSSSPGEVMALTSTGEVQRFFLVDSGKSLSSESESTEIWFGNYSLINLKPDTQPKEPKQGPEYALIIAKPGHVECIRADNQTVRIPLETMTEFNSLHDAGKAGLWTAQTPTVARYLPREVLLRDLSHAALSNHTVNLDWREYLLPFPADGLNKRLESLYVFVSSGGERIAGYDRGAKQVWIERLHRPEDCMRFLAREVTVLHGEENGDRWWWNDEYNLVCWDSSKQTEPFVLASFHRYPEIVAISSDRTMIAVIAERICAVWDIDKRKLIGVELVHESELVDVSFSPSGKTLMTLEENGSLNCWNIATGRRSLQLTNLYTWYKGERGRFLQQGEYLAVANSSNRWRIERLAP